MNPFDDLEIWQIATIAVIALVLVTFFFGYLIAGDII